MQQLNPRACALAFGTVWGLGMVILALFAMFHGTYGNTIIGITSSVYLGYDNTIPGAIIGGIWGFVDGGIGGYVFAWLYNRFLV